MDTQKILNNEENKNEEQKESQITLMNIFGFTFYAKNIFCLKT